MSSDGLLPFVEQYLRDVLSVVDEAVVAGSGADVLGTVPGRTADEDVEIELDRICDRLFESSILKSGLRISVNSEHGNYGSDNPLYRCMIDPFDGSGLFRRGLRKEWYSVLSILDLNGKPIVGGALDIRSKEIYLASEEGVMLVSLWDDSRTGVHPSRKSSIDGDTIISAYTMNLEYRIDWNAKAKNLNEGFPGLIWGNGGACIYPLIASGDVHAYVMFEEPRSEIDPGLAFAASAKYPLFAVDESGLLTPYEVDISKHLTGRVPFFIAACTEGMAADIASVVLKGDRC